MSYKHKSHVENKKTNRKNIKIKRTKINKSKTDITKGTLKGHKIHNRLK